MIKLCLLKLFVELDELTHTKSSLKQKKILFVCGIM